jgi:hypothetical protein
MSRRGWPMVIAALAAASGCVGEVCEDAAQICADEMRVSSPSEDSSEDLECVDQLEAHAECIVREESCAPGVVRACWAEVGGEPQPEAGAGGGG